MAACLVRALVFFCFKAEEVMTDTASPQLEDGYTRIANELLKAIWSMPFTHQQHKVIFAVIQKTYGFNKKEDDVSASQLGDFCSMKRENVTRTLNELVKMNVITKRPGTYGSVIGLQKDHKKWAFSSVKPTQACQLDTSVESTQGVSNPTVASVKPTQVDSVKSTHTKDNLPKDNQQKTCANASAFARFWSAYPKKKSKGQAEKAFSKIKPSEQLLDAMVAAVERAKTSEDWRKDGGRFIPYPATWLNAKGWEDEDTSSPGPSTWWVKAGFTSIYEAENAGCTQFNVAQFLDNHRLEAHA